MPVVRLLAAVPSVIYGLIGILVLVPFVNDHLVSDGAQGVGRSTSSSSPGTGLLVSVVILTVMITPIMIAIIIDALYAVPRGWQRGRGRARRQPLARDVDASSVRAARPAIIAGAVLACARALGEAIMLSMVSGSKGFAPNPADGLTFIFEPLRTLASTIVEDAESLNAPAVQASRLRVRAAAAVLEPRALDRRLGGQAADEEVRDPRLMAVAPRTEPLRPRARRASAASTSRCAPGAGATASPSCCAGRRASRCARSPAAIVVYMAVKGLQYLNLDAADLAPAAVGRPEARAASWTRSSGRSCSP